MKDYDRLMEIRERASRKCVSWDVIDEVQFLLEQLDQRDKTITDLLQTDNKYLERCNEALRGAIDLKQQNKLMLYALERILHPVGKFPTCAQLTEYVGDICRSTIAQVKGYKEEKFDWFTGGHFGLGERGEQNP